MAAMLCAVALVSGCRHSNGAGVPSASPRNDPLLSGARIPPQNLPVPGRDGYANRDKKDPLLGTPTKTDDKQDRSVPVKGQEKNLPDNGSAKAPREPYRPGPSSTTAALAGRLPYDDTTLSIGDRRPASQLASQPKSGNTEADFDRVTGLLKKMGATWEPVTTENGQSVFRVDVPIDPDQPGRIRRYEGVGPTPATAAEQALQQIRGDREAASSGDHQK